jgi:hypothetical protein
MVDANRDVFVNCPFDDDYRPLFYAIVFTVIRSGWKPRCALETDNAAENRLDKICRIIAECQFSVHDISRTETDGSPPLPRFNMPLELGLFLGARKFGGRKHKEKVCIVFDREKYRYQKFISDIAGQDIQSHAGSASTLIEKLATWLRQQTRDPKIPGGSVIAREFASFNELLPAFLQSENLSREEIGFGDYCHLVTQYFDSVFG